MMIVVKGEKRLKPKLAGYLSFSNNKWSHLILSPSISINLLLLRKEASRYMIEENQS